MINKEIINLKTFTMKSQTLVAFLMDSDKYLRKKWVPTPAASQEKKIKELFSSLPEGQTK